MIIRVVLFISLCYLTSCQGPDQSDLSTGVPVDSIQVDPQQNDFYHTGKDSEAEKLPAVFTAQSLDSLELPIIDASLIEALEYQLKLLKIRKQENTQQVGNLELQLDQLEAVIDQLLAWQYTQPLGLSETLDAHQIWGEDKKGNVHFTGYYIPVIPVSRTPGGDFQHPIYTRPKNWPGPLPTRGEIDGGGVLKGQGLELAFAKNLVDVYFMQVQGSGYVEYRDGQRMLFAYNGTNNHPYRSIGRNLIEKKIIGAQFISMNGIKQLLHQNPHLRDTVLFHNPSYTFFTPQRSSPRGAGLVPLTSDHSIAVDTKYIPLGSVLLAQVPVVNERGHFLYHEFRFLVAQDVGGAIRGPGHVDLYSGAGTEGRNKASYLHHYGKLWLLLPKKPSSEI